MRSKCPQLGRLTVAISATLVTTGLALADDAVRAKPAGTLDGHTAAVYSVAWTPDGSKLVTGAFDTTLRVWDASTLKPLKTLEGHTGLVLCVALDPLGKRILSGSLDKSARVWEMPGAATPSRSLVNESSVRVLAVRPDGKHALAASGRTLAVWDLVEGKAVRTITGLSADVEAVAWRPDSAQVASGDQGGMIRFSNPLDGSPQGFIDQPADTVLGLAYLPNGQGIISAGSDGLARLWALPLTPPVELGVKGDLFALSGDGGRFAAVRGKEAIQIRNVNGSVVADLKDLPAPPIALALNGAGSRVAAAYADQTIRLYEVADGRELFKWVDSPAVCLAFRADGLQVASGGADGTIYIFDVGKGKLARELKGHKGRINALTFFPNDGDRLASAATDKLVKLWSVGQAKSTQDIPGHTDAVVSIAVSRDGKTLVSGSLDKSSRIWNVEKTAPGAVCLAHNGPVTSIALAPDGQRFATVSADGSARLWTTDHALLLERRPNLGTSVQGVGFDPTGRSLLLLGTGDGKSATSWTPAAVRTFEGHAGPVNALAITPNSDHVITVSSDKTARIFDINSGKELHVLPGHEDAVRSVAVSRDGQVAATGSSDKTARTWSLGDGKPKLTYPLGSTVNSVAFAPDSKAIVVGLAEGSAKVLDLNAAEPAKAERLSIPVGGAVVALGVLPDGNSLVTASDNKRVQVWPLISGGPKVLNGHSSQVYCVGWSSDGNLAVTGGGDASVRIWDVAKASPIRAIEKAHATSVYSVLLHPRGDLLITAGDDKVIKYWNPLDGKEVRKGEGHGGSVYCLAFRPGHAMIASGSIDKTVRLWNVADGKEVRLFSGHPDDVYALAFTPDGKHLASIGYAGNLFFWDVDTGKPIFHQKVAPGVICYGLSLSPDGRRLAVTGSDHKTYLFDLP